MSLADELRQLQLSVDALKQEVHTGTGSLHTKLDSVREEVREHIVEDAIKFTEMRDSNKALENQINSIETKRKEESSRRFKVAQAAANQRGEASTNWKIAKFSAWVLAAVTLGGIWLTTHLEAKAQRKSIDDNQVILQKILSK